MQTLNGFVKVHRKLIQWGWYQDYVVKDLFLHLLLTVNFKDNQWMGRTIHKGQVVTSIKHLSEELGFSIQQIRTALNKLKSTGEITSESTNRYTVITVVNWEKYQTFEFEEASETTITSTNEQQTINIRATNNQQQLNNEKKEKKVKKEKNNIEDAGASCEAKQPKRQLYYPLDAKLNQAMIDFVEYRKKIKAPMTDRAVDLMIGKLDSMTADNNEKIAILEQSIVNGWKGVFPLRNENTKKADDNDFFRMAEKISKEEGVDLF